MGQESMANYDQEGRNARRPNPVDIHVGSRVRLRRMLVGMSQEKLGEFLGLTFQQVQKYEQGKNRIGASRLHAISQVLGVSIQYFYDELEGNIGVGFAINGFRDPPPENLISDFMASREGIDLIKAIIRIKDPAVRRAIISLAQSLAGDDEAS